MSSKKPCCCEIEAQRIMNEGINIKSFEPRHGNYGFNTLSKLSNMNSALTVSKKVFDGLVKKLKNAKADIFSDENDDFYTIFSYGDNYNIVKLNMNESMNEDKFTSAQIKQLRKNYDTINRINPSSPTYDKLTKFLDDLPTDKLKQLAKGKIKFISSLAQNRVRRRTGKFESVNESLSSKRKEITNLVKSFNNTAWIGIQKVTSGGNRIDFEFKASKFAKDGIQRELDKMFPNAQTVFVNSGNHYKVMIKEGVINEVKTLKSKNSDLIFVITSIYNNMDAIEDLILEEKMKPSEVLPTMLIPVQNALKQIQKIKINPHPDFQTSKKSAFKDSADIVTFIKDFKKLSNDFYKETVKLQKKPTMVGFKKALLWRTVGSIYRTWRMESYILEEGEYDTQGSGKRSAIIEGSSINESGTPESQLAQKLAKKVGGNEIKFYDELEKIQSKIGHPKYMLWISAALKGHGVNMYKNPKIKNPQEAEEFLYNISK